jgi:transposase InsO family protein
VDEFEVRLMCEVLEVSPSGYYASRKRSPCARAIADERLLLNVRIAHEQSGRTYGAPRVQRELKDDGIDVGTKRVARLMREDGLVGRAPRRKRPLTTDSAHAHPIAPNLLERQFDVNGVTLNQVWVSDITYVPTRAGWLYLATVLDLASRRVVGWAMRDRLAPTFAGTHSSLRPRKPVRVRRLSDRARDARDDRQHESQGKLLGQRRRRELLRHPRAGADHERDLGDAG